MFNLQINNATLQDEAVYECQVGPNGTNKPIRASAKLNVLCKFIISILHSVCLFSKCTKNFCECVYYFRICITLFSFSAWQNSENRIFHCIIVSVPPTGAELVGHKSGGELQVREQDEVELKCIIHNARPKPDIIWYLGDKELVKGI